MWLPRDMQGSHTSSDGQVLLLGRAALVAVTVLIQIPRLVAGMVVVFTGDLLLTSLVAMAVLIKIARLVAGMIVMLSGLFLRHAILLLKC